MAIGIATDYVQGNEYASRARGGTATSDAAKYSMVGSNATYGFYGALSNAAEAPHTTKIYMKDADTLYSGANGNDTGRAYGRGRVEELVRQYGENDPYSKALRGLEKSFDSTFPNAPEDLKDAWIDMSIDTGMNHITGISLDGKSAHISQILAQKAVRDYNIEHGNYQYVEPGWGESVESIIKILQKGIYDIDNPLAGQPERSIEVQKMMEIERGFYASMLKYLGAE